ncbi:MAG: PAS domain-containing protein [Gammaproteobacteria bacterium]|nr:PAS domain-containing protein [Gammaproteobacteria bacterium]
MKPNITPNDTEHTLNADDFIVSKTDPKGRILYCNRIFMRLAGYKEAELLGKQHNIIRHPDMPRTVFQLLWDTVQKGEEFFGYIKNLSRDGGFYWVFANVTPSYDPQGQLVGYYSVRRKPEAKALDVITPLYGEMLAAEKAAGPKQAMEAAKKILHQRLSATGTTYEHFVLEI